MANRRTHTPPLAPITLPSSLSTTIIHLLPGGINQTTKWCLVSLSLPAVVACPCGLCVSVCVCVWNTRVERKCSHMDCNRCCPHCLAIYAILNIDFVDFFRGPRQVGRPIPKLIMSVLVCVCLGRQIEFPQRKPQVFFNVYLKYFRH